MDGNSCVLLRFLSGVYLGLTNLVIGRVTRDAAGGNAGLGFEVPVGRGFKIYTEARYHYGSGGAIPTRMIPFTIGVRY
jgi:hypothetical protein